ncbi:MAG: hypothetical protein H6868_10065 [Rhodospirillales bacterium]|nr:hypothetical protein [Rhodospirillales bacterium]
MYSRKEWKNNLLGSLEIALLMRNFRDRFESTPENAVKSFAIPAILFPLAMMVVFVFPNPYFADDTAKAISFLYAFRLMISWGLFLGAVYWISRHIDRREHFLQFVIAYNWLSLAAAVMFAPIAWLVVSGAYSYQEMYPLAMCVVIYTYYCTAFIANATLRIPWELAGFVTMICYAVNTHTLDVLHWIGSII